MGDPGTKAKLLSLEELEAAGGLRTGRKHVLSILVENKPGVLTRIAGLFARRGVQHRHAGRRARPTTSTSRASR